MQKIHRQALIGGAIVLLLAGTVGMYVFYVLPHRKAAAKPVEAVMIPEYLARYAEAIRSADQKVGEHAQQMRDGAQITLKDLHGFFGLPLKQKVVYQQLRTPGDPRDYRKGVHQGIDFYQTKRGDPIYAAAPGVIIRIDQDYKPVEKKFRDELLKLCDKKWNGTPGSVGTPPVEEPYGNVLDKLSGRQVMVYHGKNAQNEPLLSLYAHMLDVNEQLALYALVTPETVLGHIGNSGTSGEADHKPQVENHLHLELIIGGMYWTPKEPSEIGKKQPEPRYTELQKMVLQALSQGATPPANQPGTPSATATP